MSLLPRLMGFNDPFPLTLKRVAHAIAPKKFRDPFEEFEREIFDLPGATPRDKTPGKDLKRGVWYTGNPPYVGDYIASKAGDSGVFRHWNGSAWSLPWGAGLVATRDRQASKPATKSTEKIRWQILR